MPDARRTPEEARWHYASPRAEAPPPPPGVPVQASTQNVHAQEPDGRELACGHRTTEQVWGAARTTWHCRACALVVP